MAAGICDRCGMLYQLSTLQFQLDWRGLRLQNLRILVCDSCLDVPQEQLRARIIPPDPIPIPNARPEPFTVTGISIDETNYMFDENGAVQLVLEDGSTGIGTEGTATWPGYYYSTQLFDENMAIQIALEDGVTLLSSEGVPDGSPPALYSKFPGPPQPKVYSSLP